MGELPQNSRLNATRRRDANAVTFPTRHFQLLYPRTRSDTLHSHKILIVNTVSGVDENERQEQSMHVQGVTQPDLMSAQHTSQAFIEYKQVVTD